MGTPTLSSAMTRFTSEFGMGSGGSMSLWPPGKTVELKEVISLKSVVLSQKSYLLSRISKVNHCYVSIGYAQAFVVFLSVDLRLST